MPTYEYACTSCDNEWETEQSIKDAPLTECPACHQPTARRQISRGVGFILKGSGWYSDLYSSASNKKPESAEKSTTDKSATDKGAGGGDKGSSGSSTPDASSSSSGGAGSDKGSSSKPSTGAGSSAAA